MENISKTTALQPNEGKSLTIETDYGTFSRFPVKTHVIMKEDVLEDILDRYVVPHLKHKDIVFISEKIVAITQGRAFPVSEIKINFWAKLLSRFVYKSGYGIGIGAPATMELCIREIGLPKVLLAGAVSVLGKLIGVRGLFYRICGMRARAIDGPCEYTIPPYNTYAKMAPHRPNDVARKLRDHIQHDVIVIDANDIGVNVLGKSLHSIPNSFCEQVFDDNPLDQCDQQTPIAIVRIKRKARASAE